MWHYLFFIILLKVKLPTEFTGPESYVYSMIQVALCIRLSIISCSCSIVPLYLVCLWRRVTYSHSEWAGNCKHHSCVLRLIKNVVMSLVTLICVKTNVDALIIIVIDCVIIGYFERWPQWYSGELTAVVLPDDHYSTWVDDHHGTSEYDHHGTWHHQWTLRDDRLATLRHICVVELQMTVDCLAAAAHIEPLLCHLQCWKSPLLTAALHRYLCCQ